MGALKTLFKQPYWVITLAAGVGLIGLTSTTLDKDLHWSTHPPSSLFMAVVGGSLVVCSMLAFASTLWPISQRGEEDLKGLDPTRLKECDGAVCTNVGSCEIRVVNGRIEDHRQPSGAAIVLPCNEYFDDRCVSDVGSSLGAYANRVFDGRVAEFTLLVKAECRKKFGMGVERLKTEKDHAESFGPGKCLLLIQPLGGTVPIALVSTTTQRPGEGLAARISYMFEGMRELFTQLADARISEAVMPILGAGHGQIDPPLAFVGLLLAVAEAAHYGRGGQRLRSVTFVVFQKDAKSAPEVDPLVVRRALALVGSKA